MRLADVEFDSSDRGVVARVSGEIDLSNAASLGAALADAMPNHEQRLILDMTAVEYLDSAGIQLIYQLRERLRARGQNLVLVIPTPSPSHDALRLAGLTQHVEMVETLKEAVGDGS
jgi:anti-sigma B factor antagonist